MKNLLTKADVIREMRKTVKAAGSTHKAARVFGLSQPRLHKILQDADNPKRGVGEKVCETWDLEEVLMYRVKGAE